VPLLLRRFFTALQYFTRLPVPRRTSQEHLGKAAIFFPLIGVIVGGLAALVLILLQRVLPLSTAVLCTIAFAAFLTNALHEDGFADTFDGFGGGWSKERIVEIMRDSRIGVYGALALIFLILCKFNFLSALSPNQNWRWLIVGHTAARWTTLPLSAWLPYAGTAGQGKLVAKQIGRVQVLVGTFILLPALLLLSWQAALITFLVAGVVTLLSGLYFRARLGGITGDCLGAANQFTEVALYLAAVVLARFGFVHE
jgi:adenosylcobinamide-GDP ribazoletransferase